MLWILLKTGQIELQTLIRLLIEQSRTIIETLHYDMELKITFYNLLFNSISQIQNSYNLLVVLGTKRSELIGIYEFICLCRGTSKMPFFGYHLRSLRLSFF